ncbi:hypothetical protein LG634_22655 [Streptomyces bambusae]|uniref:hypothetical protein n=1 Tax=Streptomyces bambusae TaxID=1550616 RepID=UPI001CFEC2B4|nr:hypothetical protein [Streptomyces bambusae]MCB5167618.1 hypothetical protein [Streptomyces bambusae]
MRKALTVPALALASAMALAGPATAFAADGGTHPGGTTADATPTATPTDAKPTKAPATATLDVTPGTARPGTHVTVTAGLPAGSTHVRVSSDALGGSVPMTEGKSVWNGRGTVVQTATAGPHTVTLTATGPDGKPVGASAQLTVRNGKPTPVPVADSLSLSADHGRPGDRIRVTVKTAATSAYVDSGAFGGRVGLKRTAPDTWTGTAVVAPHVKTGYYGVDAYAGGRKFDTWKFTTDATGGNGNGNGHRHGSGLKPLQPAEHRTPKGSVNTGQAAPAAVRKGVDDGLLTVGGASAATAVGLAGAGLLRRRRQSRG